MAKESNFQILKSLDEKKFRSYCDFFKKHNLEEFYINENGLQVSLKTKVVEEQKISSVSLSPTNLNNSIPPVPNNANSPDSQASEVAAGSNESESSNYQAIIAPTAGTYYQSPSPDAAPFIKVGQTIKKGDKVCIIEAMKVLTEITSDKGGEVYKILVKDLENVEQGQELVLLK